MWRKSESSTVTKVRLTSVASPVPTKLPVAAEYSPRVASEGDAKRLFDAPVPPRLFRPLNEGSDNWLHVDGRASLSTREGWPSSEVAMSCMPQNQETGITSRVCAHACVCVCVLVCATKATSCQKSARAEHITRALVQIHEYWPLDARI